MAQLPGSKVALDWSHGRAEVWPLSGALHHLEFDLPGRRRVRPLAEAPWQNDRATTDDKGIPAHLRFLGGEWPCVPFGKTETDPMVHGYGTDNCWHLEKDGDRVVASVDYPDRHPVAGLRRTVRGVPGEPRIEMTLEVHARRDCTLPIGLHPILALGEPGETVRIEGAYKYGETFPVMFEPGVSKLAAGPRFESVDALPLAAGGAVSFGDLLQQTTEEAFQLFGTDGAMRVVYPGSGHTVCLTWDSVAYPTCLFWISTGGRKNAPWNGRFRGFGVEPLDARFAADGVIIGGRRFAAGETWTTHYGIGAEAPI
jgi:hypothetical protein